MFALWNYLPTARWSVSAVTGRSPPGTLPSVMKPNFLIIGAAKSGTTSLYYYLKQHPQVYMPAVKETRFFELHYDKGMEFYWDTYFSGWAGQPAIGEASPCNLYLPYVPQRIKSSLPHVKLISILRNPVDRAFSHWWMTYSMGVERLSFEEAIQSNLQQLDSGFSFEGEDGERLWRESVYWMNGESRLVTRLWYVDMGYYAQQLHRYLALFPQSQIMVLFFEDLLLNPRAVVRRVLEFIEIPPDAVEIDYTPQMVATPRSGLLLLKIARYTRVQHLIPKRVRAWVARQLNLFGSKPHMAQWMREQLVEHYRDHNKALEQIVERDLSHWGT